MENRLQAEKDREIREYSIKENVFFTALVATKMPELFEKMKKSEVMAVAIEIAERFQDEHPDGSVEQLEAFAKEELGKLL